MYVAAQSVQETAKRLGVTGARVRHLLASGRLGGQKVGSQWVVDGQVAAQWSELAEGARSRPLSTQNAWSSAALLDGQSTAWLSTSERSRLRSRWRRADIADPATVTTVRWWMQTRAVAHRYRIASGDIEELLHLQGVVAGGISAAHGYGIGLSHSNEAEIYVGSGTAEALRDEFFLSRSQQGNLVMHVVADTKDWHLRTARNQDGRCTVPRLIAATDLLDSTDTRSRTAGVELLSSSLGTVGKRSSA